MYMLSFANVSSCVVVVVCVLCMYVYTYVCMRCCLCGLHMTVCVYIVHVYTQVMNGRHTIWIFLSSENKPSTGLAQWVCR